MSKNNTFRKRFDFSKIPATIQIPNLIEVQKRSYDRFLQMHHLRTTCKNCGSTVITDPFHPGDVLCSKCGTYNANTPDFCNKCGDPVGLQLKYDVNECEERGMTYS